VLIACKFWEPQSPGTLGPIQACVDNSFIFLSIEPHAVLTSTKICASFSFSAEKIQICHFSFYGCLFISFTVSVSFRNENEWWPLIPKAIFCVQSCLFVLYLAYPRPWYRRSHDCKYPSDAAWFQLPVMFCVEFVTSFLLNTRYFCGLILFLYLSFRASQVYNI